MKVALRLRTFALHEMKRLSPVTNNKNNNTIQQ